MSRVQEYKKKKERAMLEPLGLDELLHTFRNMAKTYRDGHYTILSFTTGYKAYFGSGPWDDLDIRDFLGRIKPRENLKDAVLDALVERYGIDA